MNAYFSTAILAMTLVMAACSSSGSSSGTVIDGPKNTSHSAETTDTAPAASAKAEQLAAEATNKAAALQCGAAECGADEYCDERFKGHASDEQGRPLQRMKCLSLPEACRAERTCACVTQYVSATGCTDDDGRIRTNDYPR